MNNDERRRYDDHELPGAIGWEIGLGRSYASDILWRCDTLRAGRLYNRNLFGTREEAEQFAASMREVEPDQMFNVEAIKASAVWN